MNRRRVRIFYRLLAGTVSTVVALLSAELALRWREAAITRSEQLDAGFIRPDLEMGWGLAPGWQGRHRHRDFDVVYHVNAHGLRADTEGPAGNTPWIAVVGDSFTFGLGVNDDETFVHQLRRLATNRFVNCAVPGTSTDQQALLIERNLLALRPATVLLVVYLGNDPFDNLLGMPLQVNIPKPRFAWTNSSLVLIPPAPRAAAMLEPRPTLSELVLGTEYSRSWRARMENRFRLVRLVSERLGPIPGSYRGFPVRAQPSLELTLRIVERIQNACTARDVNVVVALLTGRSWLETPGSVSGQFQDHLRSELAGRLQTEGIPTIDLCVKLREKCGSRANHMYHPHDGHLTSAGHRAIAEVLAEHSATLSAHPPASPVN